MLDVPSSFTSLLLKDFKARDLFKSNVDKLSTRLNNCRMWTLSVHHLCSQSVLWGSLWWEQQSCRCEGASDVGMSSRSGCCHSLLSPQLPLPSLSAAQNWWKAAVLFISRILSHCHWQEWDFFFPACVKLFCAQLPC